MDTSNMVNDIIAAEVARRAAGQSGTSQVNPRMLKLWKSAHPTLPVEDSSKLMEFIDGRAQAAAASRSDGNTQMLVDDMSKAQMALKEIYGINAYTPKGMVNPNIPSD